MDDERLFKVTLKIEYMRGPMEADGRTPMGEVEIQAEGGAPTGEVTPAVTTLLARMVVEGVSKVTADLDEDPEAQYVRLLAHRVAHHNDPRAREALAAYNARKGTVEPETMAPGTAPSIEELNAMFAAAGYGPGDCVAGTDADGRCLVHGIKH